MDWLRAEVKRLYERNRQLGHADWCDRDYDFVCPSAATYPFQWFWDSCFHAVVLSHFDVGRARSELSCLTANAQPDGFLPHVVFWQRERFADGLAAYNIAYRTPYLSDHIQPPVLPEAIEAVVERGGADDEWLPAVVAAARRFFDWLDRVRDPDQDGLIAIVQPDESGLDHSPKYDEYLGVATGTADLADFDAAWARVAASHAEVAREPGAMFASGAFICEDVLVNTIYCENQLALGRLLARLGDHDAALAFAGRAARTLRALEDKCWDEEARLYFDLAGAEERALRVSTVSSLLPLVLEGIAPERAGQLIAHLEDVSQYGTPFPAPSVAVSDASFSPQVVGDRLLWRGPTWMNTNWYLARGLRRRGRADLAQRLIHASVELVQRSGFREYYDPFTGAGYGAPDFSWSALVLDMVEA